MDHERHEPHERRGRLLYGDEVYQIQGAVFEVNRELGIGFLETVYQESLGLEFRSRGIPYVAQPQVRLAYKGTALRAVYVPDFV